MNQLSTKSRLKFESFRNILKDIPTTKYNLLILLAAFILDLL